MNLKSLVARLNDPTRRALESAAGLCLSRTNYNVEIEHWLLKLLEDPKNDLGEALRSYEIDSARVVQSLTRQLDKMKSGNSRPPALSPDVVKLAREAWLLASIEFGATQVRSGHMLLALLSDESLARQAREMFSDFDKIAPDVLRQNLPTLMSTSQESGGGNIDAAQPAGQPGDAGLPMTPGGGSGTASLDQFTIDLTQRARDGHIDPVLGRDPEIRQLVDILMRRRQNNPILTGEAGVGKTAVVEGFALRIAADDVPPPLQGVTIRSLDLTLLQAGASVKGEFENRLKSVIDEVKASPKPIIVFIDEAHTLIGAGGQAGQGDAANILKPALARGELRTIAATTWAEYKKYFERDAALARRFQVVKVEEPTEDAAIEMLRGLVKTLEKHHQIRILDEAVVDAARLSHRYISGRQLPDKAVSLIDTACARVAIGQTAVPPQVEDLRRQLQQLDVAIGILEREQIAGADHSEQLDEMASDKASKTEELAAMEVRWEAELALVRELRDVRQQLEGESPGASADNNSESTGESAADTGDEKSDASTSSTESRDAPELSPEELRVRLESLSSELETLQGEDPLMQACVDAQAIASVVANWTGIPIGRMVADQIQTVLSLKEKMEESVVGQTHAMDAIAQRVRTSRAKLSDPNQPIGIFLLAGTSGVGKTETAITLANLLYGGEQNMTVINMSEFKEEHKVSLLMGSPPGYVGYGEGGVLTEAVRRKPYSVVLLDEMEKAHPGVQDIFYQVFDKGMMKDSEGRDIDFKNTLIIMTSNAGTDLIKSLCADPETRPTPEGLAESLHDEMLKSFKPAFLGRCSVVPYYPLADDVMRKIIHLKLDKIVRRVEQNYQAELTYSDTMVDSVLSRCQEVDTGARNVDHILTRTLLPELSAEFLAQMAEGQSISGVHVDVGDDKRFTYAIND
jgi:type VI secretion system protein VasG